MRKIQQQYKKMNIFWYMTHDRICSTSKKSICLFIAFSFGGWGGERAVKRGDWGADQWWPWLPREVSSYSFRLNICFVGGISKQIFITFEKFPLKINSLHCQQSIWPTTGTLGRQQTASSSRKEETYQLLKWYIASTKFNGNTSCKNWVQVYFARCSHWHIGPLTHRQVQFVFSWKIYHFRIDRPSFSSFECISVYDDEDDGGFIRGKTQLKWLMEWREVEVGKLLANIDQVWLQGGGWRW